MRPSPGKSVAGYLGTNLEADGGNDQVIPSVDVVKDSRCGILGGYNGSDSQTLSDFEVYRGLDGGC